MMKLFRKHVNIIPFLLLISCIINIGQYAMLKKENSEAKSVVETVSISDPQKKNEIFDSEYKLFYGEWEIKEYINYTASIPKSTAEEGSGLKYTDIIGTKIYYNRDRILNNNTIVCTSPIYTIGIIPVLEKEQLFLGKHSMSIKDLGITGEYFNFVSILNETNSYSDEIIGTTFYVVDNNTLILEYKACEFIMKRTAFIDNADIFENEHN